ncbi:MAG: hypothetical protein A3J40_13205 [Erythrobacter sp. RIFCSPHIGHO2_12_FULL_63_10]|nr:MAG: hypothetical protein A3J40_13205 [Erythrobacter sp. RIFCSPHIGHO2_12_FULL_63_10]
MRLQAAAVALQSTGSSSQQPKQYAWLSPGAAGDAAVRAGAIDPASSTMSKVFSQIMDDGSLRMRAWLHVLDRECVRSCDHPRRQA